MIATKQVRWRLSLCAIIVELAILIAIPVTPANASFSLMAFVAAPYLLIVTMVLILWLLAETLKRNPRQVLSLFVTTVVFWAIPAAGFFYNREHPFELRETARWLVLSRHYKSEVLAQPQPAPGGLRHIVWDYSGFAGIANNTVYLIFDPTDTLSSPAEARNSRKPSGLPCEVWRLRRLEPRWYAALFYTDEFWDQCGQNRHPEHIGQRPLARYHGSQQPTLRPANGVCYFARPSIGRVMRD